MTDSRKGYVRMRTLQAVVLLIFGVIILRLAYIQLIDPKYEKLARGNALRHVVQYPPRGEIFDRNGEYLAQNRACYDLMVIYRELPREGFDTLQMLDLLGISRTKLERALRNARMSPRIPYMVTNFISSEVKLRFDENNFPGFYTVYRTIRSYPRKIGGNLLGDVGEINAAQLKRNPRYRAGDYIGQSGVERPTKRYCAARTASRSTRSTRTAWSRAPTWTACSIHCPNRAATSSRRSTPACKPSPKS